MTVLQVCAFGAPNAGNFIASLTYLEKRLSGQGINTIYAFVERARDKDWCKEIQNRTKVYFLPEAKARILPKTYKIFRQIYKENDIDIVHSHFELYDIPATVMAPKHIKVFWHLHDALKRNYIYASSSRKILTKLQYGMFSGRATLLSVSQEHAAFAGNLGFNEENIIYLPNGIGTDRIIRTPLEKPDNNFLMFGWEVERKGVDLVVNAAFKMQNTNCKIIVVGQEECKKFLSETPHPDTIFYSEPVENINSLYKTTKAFLHVSRAEGLSYALLEVIYAGIPVICSDIPENRFAKDFQNVYFVKAGASEEIASKMDEVVFIEAVREEDVAYNRQIIDEKYSLFAWAQRLEKIYLAT